MSYNIRNPQLPSNAVLMDVANLTLPTGFAQYTPLFTKYPKGIPDLCTQPGGSIGANSHTEASTGPSHDHTATGCHNHLHRTVAAGGGTVAQQGGCSTSRRTHTHTTPLNCTNLTNTVCAASFSHTHDSQSIEPLNETIRFIQKAASFNLRDANLPLDKVIWYGRDVSTVPSSYSIDSSIVNNRFHKGVPDGCTGPLTQAGASTHQHSSEGTHSHCYSLPSHTHGKPAQSATTSSSHRPNSGAQTVLSESHVHSLSGVTIGSASDSGTTATDGAHQHAAGCNIPLFRELLPIKTTKVAIRERTLPLGSILLWFCPLNTIPTGWQVADGTNGTLDTLDRYGRPVCGACTNPGTGGGAANHTHTAATHVHVNPFVHTHTATGNTGASCGTLLRQVGTPFQVSGIGHVHASVCPTDSGVGDTPTAGSHSHSSTINDPSALRVAYIQRI